jgi:hypothetical protein
MSNGHISEQPTDVYCVERDTLIFLASAILMIGRDPAFTKDDVQTMARSAVYMARELWNAAFAEEEQPR